MTKLNRPFWPVAHLAARWGVFLPEIFESALGNDLQLSLVIGPTAGDAGQVWRGIVGGDAAELWRLALREGTSEPVVKCSRIYADCMWRLLPEPIAIGLEAVVVTDAERQRFEDRHDLLQRGCTRPGPELKYRWVEMLQWLAVHLHDEGVPGSQQELIAACSQWFVDRSEDGEHPSDKSIRNYVSPVWKGLRREDCE